MTITEFLETIELKYCVKISPQKIRRYQEAGVLRDLRDNTSNERDFSTYFEEAERVVMFLATGLAKELIGDEEAEGRHLKGLAKMVKELT